MNQTEPDTFFDPVEAVQKVRVSGEVKAVPVHNYGTYCRILDIIGENPQSVAAKIVAVEIDMHVKALKILVGCFKDHPDANWKEAAWAQKYADALLVGK